VRLFPALFSILAVALTGCTTGLWAAPSSSVQYHIVFPKRAIAAGERITLQLAPPPPAGARLLWSVQDGSSGIGLEPYGVYTAPYITLVGTPPAKVTAALTGAGIKTSVEAQIPLAPGSVPGAEGCLGPGQSFSTTTGGFALGITPISSPAGLIHGVDPDYPRNASARGVEDTITVIALVCRSGHVLDAYVPTSYADLGLIQPIQQDPKLVEAAIRAVRQYEFSPAMAGGNPVASWVVTPVHFRQ